MIMAKMVSYNYSYQDLSRCPLLNKKLIVLPEVFEMLFMSDNPPPWVSASVTRKCGGRGTGRSSLIFTEHGLLQDTIMLIWI